MDVLNLLVELKSHIAKRFALRTVGLMHLISSPLVTLFLSEIGTPRGSRSSGLGAMTG